MPSDICAARGEDFIACRGRAPLQPAHSGADARASVVDRQIAFWQTKKQSSETQQARADFMSVAVGLREIRKSFGSVDAIRGINLEIQQGEFVVLVGPSGCGKSTLLRVVAGLEDATGGEITIDGAVVNDVDAADRDIAMVFQSYALYPHMTIRQNLAFGLTVRRTDAQSVTRQIKAVSGILGLEEVLDRYPRQLSGGQRQRVAMGRAMVRDPRVFLFDEPLSNLDAKLRAQMRIELKALHQRLKNTTIYVTHDQIEAMTMADRIVIMRAGRIEQIGKPLDLYDYPATAFVAQFIGSPTMNMIRGRVALGRQGAVLRTDDGIELPLPRDSRAADQQPIIIGVRPEHLALADGGLSCAVELTEPLGREILLHGKLGGNSICIAPGSRPRIEAGAHISVSYDPDRACVFDGETERSLRPHG
jgi:multiple sugar transport system ATP-binding protein